MSTTTTERLSMALLSGHHITVPTVLLAGLRDLGAESPLACAVTIAALARAGHDAHYTAADAHRDAAISEATLRRIIAWLRAQGVVLERRQRRDIGGVVGNYAHYTVDVARLADLLEPWLPAAPDAVPEAAPRPTPTPKARAPKAAAPAPDMELVRAVINAYNANRGPLPEVQIASSTRIRAITATATAHPGVDLPAAIGIAARMVSKNEFYLTNRYGLKNLLANDNWVEWTEKADRDDKKRKVDGTYDLGGVDD